MAKTYIAKEESVQDIITKTGTTTDPVGSTSTGSVMAKLNKIISDVGTHMNRWTSARAEKIDKLDANVSSAVLSSDRLGYIDRIANSTYGLDKIQALVATDNNASTTGKLSQKLTSIINSLADGTNGLKAIKDCVVANNTASTTGTLSQKISSAINNTATNNTASSTGILSQKLSYIINNGAVAKLPSPTTATLTISSGYLKSTQITISKLSFVNITALASSKTPQAVYITTANVSISTDTVSSVVKPFCASGYSDSGGISSMISKQYDLMCASANQGTTTPSTASWILPAGTYYIVQYTNNNNASNCTCTYSIYPLL